MCYGMGCIWESRFYGPHMGECRKPWGEPCPFDNEENEEEEGKEEEESDD